MANFEAFDKNSLILQKEAVSPLINFKTKKSLSKADQIGYNRLGNNIFHHLSNSVNGISSVSIFLAIHPYAVGDFRSNHILIMNLNFISRVL